MDCRYSGRSISSCISCGMSLKPGSELSRARKSSGLEVICCMTCRTCSGFRIMALMLGRLPARLNGAGPVVGGCEGEEEGGGGYPIGAPRNNALAMTGEEAAAACIWAAVAVVPALESGALVVPLEALTLTRCMVLPSTILLESKVSSFFKILPVWINRMPSMATEYFSASCCFKAEMVREGSTVMENLDSWEGRMLMVMVIEVIDQISAIDNEILRLNRCARVTDISTNHHVAF